MFASAGLSGQLGRFTRPFLDYTAASARVDVGLTSPHVVGVVPDPATLTADAAHRPDKHRAFALEGRGAWHALSVSLAQQVFGPVSRRWAGRAWIGLAEGGRVLQLWLRICHCSLVGVCCTTSSSSRSSSSRYVLC